MGQGGEKDGEAQTFESAMRELEGIVHELEAGDTGLEAAIAAYERGVKLKKFCEDKLRRPSSGSRRSTAMRTAPFGPSRSRPAEGFR